MNKKEIKSYIRSVMSNDLDRRDRKLKKELERMVKKEVDDIFKDSDLTDKKTVKDMIIKTIVKQHKFMWEKAAFYVNQI